MVATAINNRVLVAGVEEFASPIFLLSICCLVVVMRFTIELLKDEKKNKWEETNKRDQLISYFETNAGQKADPLAHRTIRSD